MFTNLLNGQKLIDVILDHEIDTHQVFVLGNTSGMSFFDFDEDGVCDASYDAFINIIVNDNLKFELFLAIYFHK